MKERRLIIDREADSSSPYHDGVRFIVNATTPEGRFAVFATLRPVAPEIKPTAPIDQAVAPRLEIGGRHIGKVSVSSIVNGELVGKEDISDIRIEVPKGVNVVPKPSDRLSAETLYVHGLPEGTFFLKFEEPPVEPEV